MGGRGVCVTFYAWMWLCCLLVGCNVVSPPAPEERFVTLEILSPSPGETGNFIHYRVQVSGYSIARVAAATPQQPKKVLTFRTGCVGPPKTCEGDLVFPVINTDVEVWVEYVDLSGMEYSSARQTVRINNQPVVMAKLSQTPSGVTWLVTGQNNLDPASLGNISVRRTFSVTDTTTATETVTGFTLMHNDNKLEAKGTLVGPAVYDFELSGVKNAFGTPLPNQSVTVKYFSPVAGAPAQPLFPQTLAHLERASDGGVLLVHATGVARVGVGSGVQPKASWTESHLGTVDRAGVPYRTSLSSPSTVDIERWDGTAWIALPQVTVEKLVGSSVHRQELAFDATNTPFLLHAVCGQGSPACTSAQVLRFDASGPAWTQVYDATFTRVTTWLELFAFGDSVALFFKERTATDTLGDAPVMLRFAAGSFVALPNPFPPYVGLVNADFPVMAGAVKSDAQGHAFVLAGMAGFYGPEPMAIVEWDGTAWSVRDDGTKAWFAHSTLGPMPKAVLDLSAFFVNAWDRSPSGEFSIFTWEQTGQGLDNVRFHAGAYRLSGSTWSPMPGVGSPLIATAERYQSVLVQSEKEVWATTQLSGTTPSALLRHDH